MDVLDATEIAYKNGYKKGKADAMRDSDLVEVTRCKDCLFYKYGDCWNIQWESYEGDMPGVKENDFCSYGERKAANK